MKFRRINSGIDFDDVRLVEENKTFSILYGRNGNMYWNIFGCDGYLGPVKFEITGDNEYIYQCFDKLYKSVKYCIFRVSESDTLFIKNKSSLLKKTDECLENNNSYDALFDGETINWYSDSTSQEDASMVKIYRKEDKYILEFVLNEKDPLLNTIEFSSFKSRYAPFNLIFQELYLDLCRVDYRKICSKELQKSIKPRHV